MAKETYFFSHDCNARNDERILMLRADHGMEGYGIYWALLEMMFETEETCLYHDKIKGIAVSYNIPISKLKDTIDTCIKEGLFNSNGNTFWSESLIRRKEKYHSLIQKRSEGGKKAMQNRWGDKSKQNELDKIDITKLKESNNDDITKNNKGKEIKRKEIKIDNNYYDELFDYYISLDLVKHRTLTGDMKKSIDLAMKELKCDAEHLKKMLHRHKQKVENTKGDGEYKTKPRALAEFFGQKKYKSTSLICSDYDDGIWKEVDKNDNAQSERKIEYVRRQV